MNEYWESNTTKNNNNTARNPHQGFQAAPTKLRSISFSGLKWTTVSLPLFLWTSLSNIYWLNPLLKHLRFWVSTVSRSFLNSKIQLPCLLLPLAGPCTWWFRWKKIEKLWKRHVQPPTNSMGFSAGSEGSKTISSPCLFFFKDRYINI